MNVFKKNLNYICAFGLLFMMGACSEEAPPETTAESIEAQLQHLTNCVPSLSVEFTTDSQGVVISHLVSSNPACQSLTLNSNVETKFALDPKYNWDRIFVDFFAQSVNLSVPDGNLPSYSTDLITYHSGFDLTPMLQISGCRAIMEQMVPVGQMIQKQGIDASTSDAAYQLLLAFAQQGCLPDPISVTELHLPFLCKGYVARTLVQGTYSVNARLGRALGDVKSFASILAVGVFNAFNLQPEVNASEFDVNLYSQAGLESYATLTAAANIYCGSSM